MIDTFRKVSQTVAAAIGSPFGFASAAGLVLVWLVVGPFVDFSEAWNSAINTILTVLTWMMVFLLQYTQNRDSKALHLKIDELICAVEPARNEMVNANNLSDEQLGHLEQQLRAKGQRS